MTLLPRIVLTGGPGGGKTTLMRELRAAAGPRAERWLFVPEAAPLLFQAGLGARHKSFQRAMVRLQIAMEKACAEAAAPGQVLICHRGTLDPLAYWLRNGWVEEEFFAFTEMSRAEHFRRYTGVIHLQREHPHYVLIDNIGRDWAEKSRLAREALKQWLAIMEKRE